MSAALSAILGLAAGASAWPLARRYLSGFRAPRNLADEVQWAIHAAPGLVANKDGSLLAAWEMSGPDLSFETPAEADALAAQTVRALGFLDKRFMLHVDSIRVPSLSYRTAEGDAPLAARTCDEARRARYDSGAHYENRTFVALTYAPPREKYRRLAQLFYTGGKETRVDWEAETKDFEVRLQTFEDRFPGALRMKRLRGSDLLSYLQASLTGELTPATPSPDPGFLDFLFAERLQSGFEPKIGNRWARVVSVQGFAENAFMGIMEPLGTLPFPYRYSTRLIGVDNSDAMSLIEKRKGRWISKAGSDMISQIFGGEEERSEVAREVQTSAFAQSQSRDAAAAQEKIESGQSRMVHYTGCVVVMHEDLGACNERARRVEKALQSAGAGFVARRESGLATEALLGTLPGHGHKNVRRYPLLTEYAARLLPLTTTYAGPEHTPCSMYEEHSPPMFYAKTAEQVPFRFSPFGKSGDAGHEIIIGPTGNGKSVLLGYQAMRQLHFPRGQAVLFDAGSSFAPLCEAMGGRRYDVGSSAGFQPLAAIEDPEERRWATAWIEAIARMREAKLTPQSARLIQQTLKQIAARPPAYRTLQELHTQIQDAQIKAALEPFCGDGALGMLMNASQDGFSSGRLQVLELGSLLQLSPDMYTPVLLYLFHHVEKMLGPRAPTFVAADEFFLFAAKTREGRAFAMEAFRTYRKKNAIMAVATQDPSDLTDGPLSAAVNSAKTTILLPNGKAKANTQAPAYRALGLSEKEITMIAEAEEKREYISKQPGGTRKWDLNLGAELAFLTAADGLSLEGTAGKMAAFKEEHGARWVEEWLRFRGFDEHAPLARELADSLSLPSSPAAPSPAAPTYA